MPIKMSDTLQNTILSTVKSLKKSFCIVASCKAGDMFYLVEFGVESLFFYCSLVLGLFPHIWLQDAKRERKKERKERREMMYIYWDSSGHSNLRIIRSLKLMEWFWGNMLIQFPAKSKSLFVKICSE